MGVIHHLLKASLVFLCLTGHVPVEDPHHSSVLCLHAREKVRQLPVALPALPHGRGHSGAGNSARRHHNYY